MKNLFPNPPWVLIASAEKKSYQNEIRNEARKKKSANVIQKNYLLICENFSFKNSSIQHDYIHDNCIIAGRANSQVLLEYQLLVVVYFAK